MERSLEELTSSPFWDSISHLPVNMAVYFIKRHYTSTPHFPIPRPRVKGRYNSTLCFSAPSERAERILEACKYYHYRGHAYNILLPLSRQKVAEIIPRSEDTHIWLFYSHQSPDMAEIQRFIYWLRVKAAIEKRKKESKKM
ncbi:hypothetical protein P5V15_001219 [Pogonomyrmex californicus]